MFKNKRTLFLTAILALFMCAISFVVFAAFETSQTYDSTASTHQISNKVVTGPSEATEISLSSDLKSETTYTLSNADAMNYVYDYTLAVSNVSDVTVLNSIFVYADDVFIGTLADYTTAKDLGLKKIIFEGTQDTPSIDDTKISYQLHNSTFENFTASITLTCSIKTPNVVNYYFVSDETDLKYAIDDVNVLSYTADIPTIVLTRDI
ncbi:MAG: hypothetical protein J6R47_02160, partial [Acholeplasmatales bacterium]|nr:hypothetical protein [Acholeplasmatales bacterium]